MADWKKTEQLYEGKAKKVYATENPEVVIVDYKDDATAFNGEKKGTIVGKGVINNRMSNFMFQLLEKHGIKTHFVEELSDRDTVVRKLKEIPGVVCECPKGAFYLMAALPVDDADKFQQWLLEEFEDNGDTVMFAPGEPFYATPGKGKNEVRIAYVLKQADLERAMDLLALGIKAYNAR